ncbi:hypothetical protein DFQ28_003949 [Apophysomyces sp. BC1034]|nr:hypothetical protein DFQ29_003195 [Apophysomyces sp. BC1021]KAG0189049.1 hypothetical protein DFQ28_003949 [Apophysomyces sp. BC1034]
MSASEYLDSATDTVSVRLKPHLPAISRFLVVATFYEDAFRILWQWTDQCNYLESGRHIPRVIASMFLAFNALLFFLRNLSVGGGLLMCLSESMVRHRTQPMFASLPQLSEDDRHKYLQLAGRVLLVLLFIGFVFNGEWSAARVVVSLVGLAACMMVVIGFRAKWSATILVSLLSIMNILINNWWSVKHSNYTRDFLKYDFFQTLSIMGGLLLLVSIGPGGLSVDEKKKTF